MKSKPKVVVAALISRKIGAMGLSRELTIRLNATLHDQLGGFSSDEDRQRAPTDERCFLRRFTLEDGGKIHAFTLIVDDTSANDHWIVIAIGHFAKNSN